MVTNLVKAAQLYHLLDAARRMVLAGEVNERPAIRIRRLIHDVHQRNGQHAVRGLQCLQQCHRAGSDALVAAAFHGGGILHFQSVSLTLQARIELQHHITRRALAGSRGKTDARGEEDFVRENSRQRRE